MGSGKILKTAGGRVYEYPRDHINLVLSNEERRLLEEMSNVLGMSMTQTIRVILRAVLAESEGTLQGIQAALQDFAEAFRGERIG